MALANEVYEAGYKEMLKPSLAYSTPPASPAAALPVSAYVGDYSNDYVGDAKITELEDRSSCFSGRRASASRWNAPIATYSRTLPWRQRPKAHMGVIFLVGPDGKASEVTTEDLNENGMGKLTRVIMK